MHELDWTTVLGYIGAMNPALAASFRGVPDHEIEACEAQFNVRLPSAYVGFLRVMGEDSGALRPFGRTQVHTFSEVVAQLPLEDDPGDRFFMIAFDVDPMPIADLKTFLDLGRSDGRDAPLAVFEVGEGAPVIVNDWDPTLGETLIRRIFSHVELDRRLHRASVFVHSASHDDGLQIKQACINLLLSLQFERVLPEEERVVCLRRGSTSALVLVEDKTHLVDLRLATDDPVDELDPILTPVLTRFERSELVQSPRQGI